MPTVPSAPGPMPGSEPHQARQVAESFGREAERYERARPTYPKAMVDAILAASVGRDVLDVGTGTGISARPFLQGGCRVLGIDPDERMADYARSSGVEVEVARFEEWGPAGRTFDLVIAGQAWHWVDPVLGASKAASVLRPGGRIAVFWNAFSFPPELAQAFAAVYRRVLPESPFFQRGAQGGVALYRPMSDKAADGIRQTGEFDEPQLWQFEWARRYTKAEWLDAVPTFGGHALVPPEGLGQLLAGIAAVIDTTGGNFTVSYTTVVVTAERRAA